MRSSLLTVAAQETARCPETKSTDQCWNRRAGGLAENSYLFGEMGLYGNCNEVINSYVN